MRQYRHCTAYNFFTIFDASLLFLLLCVKVSSVNMMLQKIIPAVIVAEEALIYLVMCVSSFQYAYNILLVFEKYKGVLALAIAVLG